MQKILISILSEQDLYQCALKIEKDEALNRDMKKWDVVLNEGLEDL